MSLSTRTCSKNPVVFSSLQQWDECTSTPRTCFIRDKRFYLVLYCCSRPCLFGGAGFPASSLCQFFCAEKGNLIFLYSFPMMFSGVHLLRLVIFSILLFRFKFSFSCEFLGLSNMKYKWKWNSWCIWLWLWMFSCLDFCTVYSCFSDLFYHFYYALADSKLVLEYLMRLVVMLAIRILSLSCAFKLVVIFLSSFSYPKLRKIWSFASYFFLLYLCCFL